MIIFYNKHYFINSLRLNYKFFNNVYFQNATRINIDKMKNYNFVNFFDERAFFNALIVDNIYTR